MKWSKNVERNQRILELFQKLKSTRLVADQMGMPLKTIGHILNSHGVPTPAKGRRANPYSACERNAELVMKLVEDGKSMNHIGKAVGTKPQEVKKFLIRNGVTKKFLHLSGKDHPLWKGRTVDKHGYVLIPSRGHPYAKKHTHYVAEHRLAMEKHLGRHLLPGEVVHHINGQKADNRIENLQLFQSNGEHLAHELKGRVPKWSPEGKENIRKGQIQRWLRKRASIQSASEPCVEPCI